MDRDHHRERDGTDSERTTSDRTDTRTESDEPLSRRDALKAGAVAVGSAAALSSTASTAAAATRHGINFDRVLHAVDDLGMDPNGNTAIDGQIDWRDGTLIEFPSGTFALDDAFVSDLTRYGWVAEDSSADPTIVPANDINNTTNTLVYWTSGEDLLFEGIDFDFTQSGYGGMLTMRLDAGTGYWLDSTVNGPQPDHSDLGTLFSPRCSGSSATIEVENFSAMDGWEGYGNGGNSSENPHGIWVSLDHAGEIIFRNCDVGYWPDNGLYADGAGLDTKWGYSSDGAGGVVKVEGCYFENNNIANIRLGTAGSYAKNCEVVVDDDCPRAYGGSNARGVWLRYENGIVLDDVDMQITGHRGGGAIVETAHTAANDIKNCTIELSSNANYKAAIYRRTGADASGSSYDNMSIVSGLDNSDLSAGYAAVDIEDTDGTSITNSCIQTTSSNKDGIEFVDSSSGSVSDTNVNATGTAVVETNSTVSTSNLTYNDSCPGYQSGGDLPSTIDDFERSSPLDEYGGADNLFSVETSTVYEGSQALTNTSGSFGTAVSTSGLDGYPERGDEVHVFFNNASDDNFIATTIFTQSETDAPDGYPIGISSSGAWRMWRRENGGLTQIASASLTASQQTSGWYRAEIWTDSTTVYADLYDDATDTLLASIQDDDTVFSSGGIGFRSGGNGEIWDFVIDGNDPPATVEVLDDFSHDDAPGTYSLDTGAFTTSSARSTSDSYSLHADTGSSASNIILRSDETTSNGNTYQFDAYMQTTSDDMGLLFGAQSGATGFGSYDGYLAFFDAGADEIRLDRWNSGTQAASNSASANWPENEWLSVEVDYRDSASGDLIMTVSDASGSQVGSVTLSDTTYDSGEVGWYTYSSSADWFADTLEKF